MELGATVAKPLLTSAKRTEVLSGLWGDIVIKVEVDTTGMVCDEVSQDSRCAEMLQWQKVGSQSCLTFDFLGCTRVGIKDRSFPGDIEEDFDCHVGG